MSTAPYVPQASSYCGCAVVNGFVPGQCNHVDNLYVDLPARSIVGLQKALNDNIFRDRLPSHIPAINRTALPTKAEPGNILMVVNVRRALGERPDLGLDRYAQEFKTVLEEHLATTYEEALAGLMIRKVFTSCLHWSSEINGPGTSGIQCEHVFLVEVWGGAAHMLITDIIGGGLNIIPQDPLDRGEQEIITMLSVDFKELNARCKSQLWVKPEIDPDTVVGTLSSSNARVDEPSPPVVPDKRTHRTDGAPSRHEKHAKPVPDITTRKGKGKATKGRPQSNPAAPPSSRKLRSHAHTLRTN